MAVAAMTLVLGAAAEDEALVPVEGGERLHAVVVAAAAAARQMTVVVDIMAIARSTNIRCTRIMATLTTVALMAAFS